MRLPFTPRSLVLFGVALSVVAAQKRLAILLGDNVHTRPTERITPWLNSVKSIALHSDSEPGILTVDGIKVDHVLLVGSRLPKDVSNEEFVQFATRGGNVLWIVEDGEVEYRARQLAAEFGRELRVRLPSVHDYHNPKMMVKSSEETANRVFQQPEYVLDGDDIQLFSHRLDGSNALVFPLLQGTPESIAPCGPSSKPDLCRSSVGTESIIASALETRTKARVTIVTASWDALASNSPLLEALLDWTFGEAGQLRVDALTHQNLSRRTNDCGYRINDLFEVRLCLSTKHSHHSPWTAVQPDDVQMELLMLDAWLRADFVRIEGGCLSTGPIRLPSRYGVYTLAVRHQRHGWPHFYHKEQLILRPFYHDEVSRFVVAALPYYLAWWSVMAAAVFAVFPLVFPGRGVVSKSKTV